MSVSTAAIVVIIPWASRQLIPIELIANSSAQLSYTGGPPPPQD